MQHDRHFYALNYDELKELNPRFPLMIRTVENAMPAVQTELNWSVSDLLRFMIQTERFRDPNGTISEARMEAAKAFLAVDWRRFQLERYKMPGFDPERPYLDEDQPGWEEDPNIKAHLGVYLEMKKHTKDLMKVIKSGPNDEYWRAENALIMCQRVDLWCAGPQEVERAVQFLYKLGRKLNEREMDFPSFISNYYPGTHDFDT